jgi:SAM-dependent methyltransferase
VLERARSFDDVADLYDELRPRYPEALFDDLLAIADPPEPPEVLEIGTGPGVATLPLAARGCHILGLEPGPHLAEVARRQLADFPDVEIRQVTFEEADLGEATYDLVVSASAWHWVDQTTGFQKVARILRPGGSFAVWWGHGSILGADALADLRAVHDRWAPDVAASRYAGGAIRDDDRIDDFHGRRRRSEMGRALDDHPAFGPVVERPHPFDTTYDARTFVRLLDTYSDYRMLDPGTRQSLFDDIVAMLDARHDGSVTRRYSPILFVAQRTA